MLISATFTVAQTGLLRGRDPVAVTAVQFLAAATAMLPVAVASEGMPAFPGRPGSFLAFVVLALGGTVLPFALFAYGQVRVAAEVAGAFLNLEPLVGAVAGAVLFSNPVGAAQVLGGAAILTGIGLSGLPLLAVRRRPVAQRPRADHGDQHQDLNARAVSFHHIGQIAHARCGSGNVDLCGLTLIGRKGCRDDAFDRRKLFEAFVRERTAVENQIEARPRFAASPKSLA